MNNFLTEEQKRDYPELEGKEVIYITSKQERQAIVVGCNYHIGVTIVAKEDKRYLSCSIGPLAPNKDDLYDRGQEDIDEWDAIFAIITKQILNGTVYSTRTSPDIYPGITSEGVSADTCPFGQ